MVGLGEAPEDVAELEADEVELELELAELEFDHVGVEEGEAGKVVLGAAGFVALCGPALPPSGVAITSYFDFKAIPTLVAP